MGKREVKIEYDFHPQDVLEAIGKLLDEYGLIFEERWIDGDPTLYLKIEEI